LGFDLYEGSEVGFNKTTIEPGDGKTFPKKGDVCHLHYVGTLADGTKFDSSLDRKKPLTFLVGIGSVIKGWDEGVLQMSVGEKARLVCPPNYAYGSESPSKLIPPNSTLYFEVTLLKIGGDPPADESCNIL